MANNHLHHHQFIKCQGTASGGNRGFDFHFWWIIHLWRPRESLRPPKRGPVGTQLHQAKEIIQANQWSRKDNTSAEIMAFICTNLADLNKKAGITVPSLDFWEILGVAGLWCLTIILTHLACFAIHIISNPPHNANWFGFQQGKYFEIPRACFKTMAFSLEIFFFS